MHTSEKVSLLPSAKNRIVNSRIQTIIILKGQVYDLLKFWLLDTHSWTLVGVKCDSENPTFLSFHLLSLNYIKLLFFTISFHILLFQCWKEVKGKIKICCTCFGTRRKKRNQTVLFVIVKEVALTNFLILCSIQFVWICERVQEMEACS